MKLVRAKQFLVTVTAIFSLFVSAVSACACSHHESVKVETESCHGSSHATSVEQSTDSNSIETDCSCLARDAVPAIVAKKDDKRAAVNEQIADVMQLPQRIAIDFEIATAPDLAVERPHSNYQQALLSSLPSRAPPRL